jgi:geranylgeranyl pyrophosphate synthase
MGTPRPQLLAVAAAVEVLHAASLIHDDVIDGGRLRRGAPAFWTEHGVRGAVLLGDMLLFLALDIVREAGNADQVALLIRMAGELCEGESRQELLFRSEHPTWEDCLEVARLKTGSLFAFAAGAACDDLKTREALIAAGYRLGTAYQLADDVLDQQGSSSAAGKTLGRDEADHTITTVSVDSASETPEKAIARLLAETGELLKHAPAVCRAWQDYLAHVMHPALTRNLKPASA